MQSQSTKHVMDKRKCGEINTSVIGTGCWAFGGGDYWGEQSQSEVNAVVRRSVESGINYFDTAEIYNDGRSEQSLGKALDGVDRSTLLIGTKIAPSNTEPSTLIDHCEASLRRLKLECVDVYMIHWPIHPHSIRHFSDDERLIANPPSIESAFGVLQNLQSQGKIRQIGVSNFGVSQLSEALAAGAKIAVNELPYSLFERAIEAEILPFCRDHNIGIIGYMPLMQGILTGKYQSLEQIPPSRLRTRHFSGNRPGSRHGEKGAERLVMQALDAIRAVSASAGMSMAELAMAWCVANQDIACVVVGARHADQIEANVLALSRSLSQADKQKLDAITEPLLLQLGTSPDYYEGSQNGRTW